MPVYLQAAIICEKILVEQDRVVSAIRIVDKLTAVVEPSRETPVLAALALLVALKFGEGPRPNRLIVDVVSPDGERTRVAESPAGIVGEEGANIHGQLQMAFAMRGVYWFHVLADTTELTRIRMNIEVAPPLPGVPIPPASPPPQAGPEERQP